jgi:cytidylate kinase
LNVERPVPVLTIDGPSGSGKGTISREIATGLGWHLLDSGALYRLVALAGTQAGLAAADVPGHAALARNMVVRFGARPDGSEQVMLGVDQQDVTRPIRSETAAMGASRVAAWPEVRTALMARQRAFAESPGLVADGRDMGTVVFPEARMKVFLTASVEERARRRYLQLKDSDPTVTLESLARDIAARDHRDMTRSVSPLVPAADAVILDTTGLSIAEVVAQVRAQLRSCNLA